MLKVVMWITAPRSDVGDISARYMGASPALRPALIPMISLENSIIRVMIISLENLIISVMIVSLENLIICVMIISLENSIISVMIIDDASAWTIWSLVWWSSAWMETMIKLWHLLQSSQSPSQDEHVVAPSGFSSTHQEGAYHHQDVVQKKPSLPGDNLALDDTVAVHADVCGQQNGVRWAQVI